MRLLQALKLLVQNAQDIHRAGEVLFKRLWLAGHGFYMISRVGTALERTIIDGSVWQTNRLDFAACSQCTPPLEQRRNAPGAHDGAHLDTATALLDLTPEEIAPKVQVARLEYIEEEIHRILARTGAEVTDEALEQDRATVSRAVQSGVLAGDFVITLDDKTEITIGEMLDSHSKYHQRRTLDPLEPEYKGFKVVGVLYLMGGAANQPSARRQKLPTDKTAPRNSTGQRPHDRINRVEYDAKTQLYLDMPQDPLPLPDIVIDEQARAALTFLMQSFKDFKTGTPR